MLSVSIKPKLTHGKGPANIDIYQISPYQVDSEPGWEKSMYCEDAPYRSVCTSEDVYRKLRVSDKTKDAWQENMTHQKAGYSFTLEAFLSGFILGGLIVYGSTSAK